MAATLGQIGARDSMCLVGFFYRSCVAEFLDITMQTIKWPLLPILVLHTFRRLAVTIVKVGIYFAKCRNCGCLQRQQSVVAFQKTLKCCGTSLTALIVVHDGVYKSICGSISYDMRICTKKCATACNKHHVSKLVSALQLFFVKYAYTFSYQCATGNKYYIYAKCILKLIR